MKHDEWITLAKDAYNISTNYLEANLRQQWADNIRMFNNKHPKGSKYNTELYTKRSRIFRPKTRSSSTQFDAALSSAFFATSELTRVIPEDKTNEMAKAGASVTTDLLSYRLSETLPWAKTLIGAAQEAWKMGDVVSYQGWAYEEDADGVVIRDESEVRLIPGENFRIDPSADWLDPINSSPYVIWVDYMFAMDVIARVKLGDDGKLGGWLPVSEDDILAARDYDWNSLQAERDPNGVDARQDVRKLSKFDLIPVHRNFVVVDGIDYTYCTLATQTLLSEPVPVTEEHPQGRPFVKGALTVQPHTVYHQGQPELGQPLQEEMNYVANDRIDNVHLVLNKRYFAKRGRNVDFRSLLRNIPGSITMMDNPMEDVQVVPTPDITQSAYVEQDKLNLDFDELLGSFSPATAQSSGSVSDSVGGMGMVQSGAGSITEFMLRNFRETWVEPVIRQLVVLELTYESEATIAAVVRDKKALQLIQEGTDDIEEFLRNLRVNVNVGISATNPQLKVEKLLYALGSLGQIHQSPMVGRLELDEITSEVFGQLGYRDGSRFLKESDKDPVVEELEQKVQQLTQQLESDRAELELKYKHNSDKLQFEVAKYQNEQKQRDAELVKTEMEAQEIVADIQETMAKIDEMSTGIGAVLETGKLQLEYDKLNEQRNQFAIANQTERDKIMVGWEQTREELAAKLEITLANSGEPSGVSKDAATVDPKELKSKDD